MAATEIPQEAIPCTVGGSECDVLVNSECDSSRSQCTCPTSYPILDLQNSYCVREAKLNTTCQFSSQCEEADEYSFCGTASICVCRTGYSMEEFPNVGFNCVSESGKPSGADPAMIGVLAGLALMFVIICVVLRLFSKARFRENRSIFNTPNPRLMNASLFKDRRRGSALSAVSATGSANAASGGAPSNKSPSPSKEHPKSETTVAIENVD